MSDSPIQRHRKQTIYLESAECIYRYRLASVQIIGFNSNLVNNVAEWGKPSRAELGTINYVRQTVHGYPITTTHTTPSSHNEPRSNGDNQSAI